MTRFSLCLFSICASVIWFGASAPAFAQEGGKAEKSEKGEKKGEPKPGATSKAPPGKGSAGGSADGKPEASKAEASKPAARPAPNLKTPQATERFQTGLKKFEDRKYTEARTDFTACLKDASAPADKKILQGYIDDTKFGGEIEAARTMAAHKGDERKAIQRIEKALKSYPETSLRSQADQLQRETEEMIYLVLDDFEPGDALQAAGEKKSDSEDDKKGEKTSSKDLVGGRFSKNQTFNSDPRFLKHGKGSMKWRVGGDYYRSYTYWYDGYGYRTAEIKNPITEKWRYLVFTVILPEADEGALRVTMAEDTEKSVYSSLYTKKFVDLRGKRGPFEVRLDLRQDFGNTANIKLEDVHYIRIDYMHIKTRTLYLDFVHLE